MTTLSGDLYFIAVLPDAAMMQTINEFKTYCKEHYKAQQALKSPPHITLVAPFKATAAEVAALTQDMQDLLCGHQCFDIQTHHFNKFKEQTLFVAVQPCRPMQRLRQSLYQLMSHNYPGIEVQNNLPFTAHITIANRDLKGEYFEAAWLDFSQRHYEQRSTIDNVMLFKWQEAGWRLEQAFELMPAPIPA